MTNFDRRSFLIRTVAMTSSLPFSIVRGQTTPVRVRRNVNELAVDDPIILSYKKAVEVMKARPANDPTSWIAQADIHRKLCPHSNWFFLPWHRSYLAWFEDICREAIGDESFALPYWDWTHDPQVPKHFWGDDNPLYHRRAITPHGVISDEFVGENVIKGRILATRDFEVFAGLKSTTQRAPSGAGILEGTPHNRVHTGVGGDMATSMSPLDPIFWLHHANVDRNWSIWNNLGNANTSDRAWLNASFTNNFVNRLAQPQSPRVSDLISTEHLGYRYDSSPSQPQNMPLAGLLLVPENQMVTLTNEDSAIPKAPFELALRPNSVLRGSIAQMAANFALPERQATEAIRLRLSEIEMPQDKLVTVRVFLNCNYLSVDTPLNSPSYVGSFCFFGLDHGGVVDGHGHDGEDSSQLSFVFDITKTITLLKRSGEFTDASVITVQLLVIPGTGAGTPLKVGKVTIEAASASG